MEEMEVTLLPMDSNDSVQFKSSSDLNGDMITAQDGTETHQVNSEGGDPCLLQSASIHNSTKNKESGVKVDDSCDERNLNSVLSTIKSSDNKSINNTALGWEPVWKTTPMDADTNESIKACGKMSNESDVFFGSVCHTEGITYASESPCQTSFPRCLEKANKQVSSFKDQEMTNAENWSLAVTASADAVDSTAVAAAAAVGAAAANVTSYQLRIPTEIAQQFEESEACAVDVTRTVREDGESKVIKDKTEKNHIVAASFWNKSCDSGGKKFQLEIKQQSSEIKDRVMSFLSKYANVDDVTSIEYRDILTFPKDECLKEKKLHACNENDSSPSNPSEEIDKKPILNECDREIAENVCEASLDRKLHSPATLEESVNSGCTEQHLSTTFAQTSDSANSQHLNNSSNMLEPSSQICKFLFSNSNNEKLPLACPSVNSENRQLVANNDDPSVECDDGNTMIKIDYFNSESNSKVKEDSCCVQHKRESVSEDFNSEVLSNFIQSNSSSWSLKDQSCCGVNLKESTDWKQPCELNDNVTLFHKKLDSNNSFFENKMPCAFISKNVTCTSNSNISSYTPHGNNTNTVPENSTSSSWGRLSFQPHTTPSINSPIFSCMTSNEKSTTKLATFTSCLPVSCSQADNANDFSSLLPSKHCSKSRRTKSSDAVFCSTSIPVSDGGNKIVNNTRSMMQLFDNSYFGRTVLNLGSEFNTLNIGKPLNGSSTLAENNTNRSIHGIFGNNGKSTSISNNTSLFTCCGNFGGVLANGTYKGSTENPFAKMSPVESIGLFKLSPLKPEVAGNTVFNSVPSTSTLFPPKREKIEEAEGTLCCTESSGLLKLVDAKDSMQCTFFPHSENKPNQTAQCTAGFAFSNTLRHESPKYTDKFVFSSGQTVSEDSNRHSTCTNSEIFPSQMNSNSIPFQFTFNAEKTKTYCTNRMTWSRPTRKPMKVHKQHDKGFSKYVKDTTSIFNMIDKGTGNVTFKPVYGSDVKLEKGINKNVIVRYQNIAFMDQYVNISPEELRSQYYAKTRVSGPFKFCTSNSREIHSDKKTQNQEIQTEKQLTPKKSELSGIWRALECPVCFDVVLPPVYQCEQGHHVCSTCWNKVITCPLCKRHKSGTRNYMAEALVEQVPLPCRYHIEGCKETVQHVNKVSHEETCTYRMYECPVPLCNQAHSYQNMCKHFKKSHKSLLHHEGHSVGKGEKFCDVLYKEALSLFLIHAFDIAKWGLFFLRKVTVHNSSALYVQIMPAAADQAAYFYHLEVSDHHDCRKECYKGRVFLMGKPTQEIVDQEEYLCLSDLILKTVNKNTPLKIVVTIWQLKPAFTLSTE